MNTWKREHIKGFVLIFSSTLAMTPPWGSRPRGSTRLIEFIIEKVILTWRIIFEFGSFVACVILNTQIYKTYRIYQIKKRDGLLMYNAINIAFSFLKMLDSPKQIEHFVCFFEMILLYFWCVVYYNLLFLICFSDSVWFSVYMNIF